MHNLGALQSNKGLLESAIASGLIENPNKGKPMNTQTTRADENLLEDDFAEVSDQTHSSNEHTESMDQLDEDYNIDEEDDEEFDGIDGEEPENEDDEDDLEDEDGTEEETYNPVFANADVMEDHLSEPNLRDFVQTEVVTIKPKLVLSLDISNSEMFLEMPAAVRRALTECELPNTSGEGVVSYNFMQPLQSRKIASDDSVSIGWLRRILSHGLNYGKALNGTPLALVGSTLDIQTTVDEIANHVREVVELITQTSNFNAPELGIDSIILPMQDMGDEEDEDEEIELDFDTFVRVGATHSFDEENRVVNLRLILALQYPSLYTAKDPVKTITGVYKMLTKIASDAQADIVVTASSSEYFNGVAKTREIINYLTEELGCKTMSVNDLLSEDEDSDIDEVFMFGGDMLITAK